MSKVVKESLGGNDRDMSELFNQMLGTGDLNLDYAYPRYKRIRTLCSDALRLFGDLISAPYFRAHPEYDGARAEVVSFCDKSALELKELFDIDFTGYEWDWTLLDAESKERFRNKYTAAKQSSLVNMLIRVCDRLVEYKKHIGDETHLSPKFIELMSGTEWLPFPFSSLNFVDIFRRPDASATVKSFFLTVLHEAYNITFKLYEELHAPDIDIKAFSSVIESTIDDLQKKVPALARCRRAFILVRQQIELLNTNFTTYYRDFISTRDSTIIMQHFILDVSRGANMDAGLTHEFHQIIRYYRSLSSSQSGDPRIKSFFDKINSTFDSIGSGTKNLVRSDKEEVEADDDEPDDVGVSSIARSIEDVL